MTYNINDDLISKTKRRAVRFWVVFAHILIIGGPLMWALWVYKPEEKITSIQVTSIPNPAQTLGAVEQPNMAPPPEAPETPSPPAPLLEPEPEVKPEPQPQPDPKPDILPEPEPEPVPEPPPPKKNVSQPKKIIEKKPEAPKRPPLPKKEDSKKVKPDRPLKRPPIPPKPEAPLKRPPLPTKNTPFKRPPSLAKPKTPSGWERVDRPSDLSSAVASNTVKKSPYDQAKSPTPTTLPPLDLPIAPLASPEENTNYLMSILHPYVASRFEPLCPKRMELNKKEPTVDVEISINADGSYSWKLLRNSGEASMDHAVRQLMVTMRRVPRKPKGPFPYITTITFTVEK